MLDLGKLKALGTRTIKVRGQQVEVRAVTASEQAALVRMWPHYMGIGRTNEEREADRSDPVHQAEAQERMTTMALAHAGIAANIIGPDGSAWDPKWTRRDQLTAWTTQVGQALSEREVRSIIAASEACELAELDELIGTADRAGN